MDEKDIIKTGHIWQGCVNANSNNANFNVRNVNSGNVNANNLYNSNDNENSNDYAFRPHSFYTLWLCNYKLHKR